VINVLYVKNTVIFLVFLCVGMGCSSEEKKEEHYFLDGYDHLEFRDTVGQQALPQDYIYSMQINGVRGYFLRDSSLTLINTRNEAPYSGYIRTFDGRNYNLQGEFKGGKMYRLRYWYGNRRLGMDVEYKKETGSIWTAGGKLAVNWNSEEMYYYNMITRQIKQIRTDTLTSYFNEDGDLTNYIVRTDTAVIHYYADGTPRFLFPITESGEDRRNGVVIRWHPNGQIQVKGQYKNGWQNGLWIEYDSLGNEISRKVFGR
jgi:antitoxin component YwqK of YwqJK toxin-antitoxin module